MTASPQTVATVALLRSGASLRGLADRLEEADSAEQLLAATTATTLFGPDEDPLGSARADLERWEREGISALCVLDEGYPANLHAVHDRPPLLFVSGALDGRDDRSVAVVGTRTASADGRRRATAVAAELAERGFTVISGLAAGIDTAAHRGAMQAGGQTIAVIGTGLRRAYPRENAALQRQLASEHAVVSQFWPDQPPQRHTFPLRNATISGLALATVLVEVSTTGGSRIQAELTLAQGRPLILLPAVLDQPWGSRLAARPGVTVLEDPGDVAAHLSALAALDAAPAL